MADDVNQLPSEIERLTELYLPTRVTNAIKGSSSDLTSLPFHLPRLNSRLMNTDLAITAAKLAEFLKEFVMELTSFLCNNYGLPHPQDLSHYRRTRS